jgi:hypothetical protein
MPAFLGYFVVMTLGILAKVAKGGSRTMTPEDIAGMIAPLLAFAYCFLDIIGFALCYRYRHLSPRLVLVLIGFVCGGLGTLLGALPFFNKLEFQVVTAFLLAGLIVHVTGLVMIVLGLSLFLADMQKQLTAPLRPPPGIPGESSDDASVHWQPRFSGNRNIQE